MTGMVNGDGNGDGDGEGDERPRVVLKLKTIERD
jgi:hypothetical protein